MGSASLQWLPCMEAMHERQCKAQRSGARRVSHVRTACMPLSHLIRPPRLAAGFRAMHKRRRAESVRVPVAFCRHRGLRRLQAAPVSAAGAGQKHAEAVPHVLHVLVLAVALPGVLPYAADHGSRHGAGHDDPQSQQRHNLHGSMLSIATTHSRRARAMSLSGVSLRPSRRTSCR